MFRYSLLLFSFFLFSSYSYSNALIPSSPVAISSEATQGASLFESLIGSSVTSSSLTGTTVGETLFGDLLSRPIVSAVITGATLIPQLSPQVRVGVALAGVLLNTPQSQLFLNPSKGGPVPLGWSGPNSPPITVTSSQQQNFSVSTVCGSYSGNSSSSACAAALGTIAGVPGECGNFTISSAGGNLCNWTYNPNGNHGVIGIPYSSSSPSCPLGYVLDSSSSCVLDENSSNGYASYPDTVPPALVATVLRPLLCYQVSFLSA